MSDKDKMHYFLKFYNSIANCNISYVEKIYQNFLKNPDSVKREWNVFLNYILKKNKCYEEKKNISLPANNILLQKEKIFKMINNFRIFGHLISNIDPLNLLKQKNINVLDLSFYQFSEEDLKKKLNINIFSNQEKKINIIDIYNILKKVYCKDIGIEYMHLLDEEQKEWIQKKIEGSYKNNFFSSEEQIFFLEKLIETEELEKYLNNKFPGAKRFSIEGGESIMLILHEIIKSSHKYNIYKIFLGMAHRGRLNVLVNVLGKEIEDLIKEFKGKNNFFGSGDVKYHMGFTSSIEEYDQKIRVNLAYNPSHLEIVNPVVIGSARACLDFFMNTGKVINVLPVNIHGDASIISQGVVQETLNMSQIEGYKVGGTIHIVINNQLGFTSNVNDTRSTLYCTDIAKMLQSPIFHVNADNPEAVVLATKWAIEYRMFFKCDVFIDLVCYRRYGHNEADEPSVTQPIMYEKIKKHPTVCEIYFNYLKQTNVIDQHKMYQIKNNYKKKLLDESCIVKKSNIEKTILKKSFNQVSDGIEQNLSKEYLKKLGKSIFSLPHTLKIHPLVAKIYQSRYKMVEEKRMFDWGTAEALAYATLLDCGISIRLSGEDSCRGTFFHRHAVIYDQKQETKYIPLQNIKKKQGKFQIWNSILSEEAVLAFEYGYSLSMIKSLTIWEAQFGDFSNGAQVVIDQFISSGEQKWGKLSNLVILLPHGYDGQGPEHSSSRLERYLQLCAENNIIVCFPSTPSQFYHLLRRQIIEKKYKPLIVLSPKSLLRHPLSVSSIHELSRDSFQMVIDEVDNLTINQVKRIIFCSGKIYYDLLEERRKQNKKNIIIIRIEQLYPFPLQIINNLFKKYIHIHDYIWCQEEPKNQGAWYYIQNILKKFFLKTSCSLRYIGRYSSASPATGSILIHTIQQKEILVKALNINY
ncbi:2-oxoglutarate dehydrogenase E1 component [Candidatus Tachikawaea gelatinosa]|uniref:oxoglutarate dehydrogenase (succinyl-transferring) n=1 Tax=Candidatus Tachikawaea gelatinosa TaxID=1410383 RepID=A0A090BWH0_9ENTR|nr:2-oxoglutarate dehydrogenase E1 component [Candidatus Tachikawaea gelatinosa]BAP58591.1 2-oxoglutarate decarboxylase thiamin-requiring [Candidatus Tachikawaea gelatinosa]